MANEVAEVKSDIETKDEKPAETPVTEPITNGSTTPESPKVEVPAVEEAAPVASPESDKSETEDIKPEPVPEQLPVNGLSLEETKSEETEVAKVEESKSDETPAESTETAPAIEIPVKKEVCVEQMPLIEPTPPPLPANPPPSSVASFAATTMALDLTEASLANTAENAISTPPAVLDTKTDTLNKTLTEVQSELTNSETSVEVLSSLTKTTDINEIIKQTDSGSIGTTDQLITNEQLVAESETTEVISAIVQKKLTHEEITVKASLENSDESLEPEAASENKQLLPEPAPLMPEQVNETTLIPDSLNDQYALMPKSINEPPASILEAVSEPIAVTPEPVTLVQESADIISDPVTLLSETLSHSDINDDLLPPPPEDDEINPKIKVVSTKQIESVERENHEEKGNIVNCNYEFTETNSIADHALNGNQEEQENVKNKSKDSLGNVIEKIECNGNIDEVEVVTKEEISTPAQAIEAAVAKTTPEDSLPPSPSEADVDAGAADASDSFPAPPSEPSSPRASPDAPEPQVNTARAALLM